MNGLGMNSRGTSIFNDRREKGESPKETENEKQCRGSEYPEVIPWVPT